MELSAVLTLRDKLSAQMDKASKSVSAMTQRVNESKDAISKIAATQNINISANSNISEMVSAAQASIASLRNTVSQKELSLQTKIDLDGLENETINAKLAELGNFLEKNSGKVEEYAGCSETKTGGIYRWNKRQCQAGSRAVHRKSGKKAGGY